MMHWEEKKLMELVRAWTRQHSDVLKELESTGVYRVKKEHICEKNGQISEYYLELYDWYSYNAARLVPRPEGAEYPIWLFLTEDTRLPPIEGTVVLALEIPRDQIVITDVERWGYRVNYMYIPLDEQDGLRHEQELQRNGIVNEPALIQTSKGNFYPLLKRKIIGSWQRVFEAPAQGSNVEQGTVWELRKEWLEGVVTDGA
ncbi:DUF3841 domain-containing protein [Oscillibacter sp.]|uniref:DUF3841 domain-containing protein n=1 Tax=Oscillibacter sp. TaxID=1945593 RepID=UPI00289F9283|nr:DUF3841 domain-containing protein [Oscillibacter sp.]